ncbi:MAG: tetratricopeptide repeat protein, partial [Pedobacter sp.]
MRTTYKILILFVSFLIATVPANAQKDADQLLRQALREVNVNNDPQKAIVIAKEALSLSPDYTDIQLLLGRLYLITGSYNEARRQLGIVLLKEPGNFDALNNSISVEAADNQPDKALIFIDRALAVQYSEVLVRKKAAMFEVQKKYKEAYRTMERTLPGKPDTSADFRSYLNLKALAGKAELLNKDTTGAKTEFLQILNIQPHNEAAINELFAISDQQKLYSEALYYAEKGLQYYPDSENFLFKKTAVLSTMGRYIEAYPIALQLNRSYPDNANGKKLVEELYPLSRRNRIGISYNYTFFDPSSTTAWNVGSIFYLREGKFASLGARINYGDRGFIGGRGYQFEIESYP